MAYKQCEWCVKNLDGFHNTRRHEEKEHPQEMALREARLDVARDTNYLAMARLEIERLTDYRAALEMTLIPPQVRALVQGELGRYSRLVWNVEYQTQALAEAQARLAELEARAPVATMS